MPGRCQCSPVAGEQQTGAVTCSLKTTSCRYITNQLAFQLSPSNRMTSPTPPADTTPARGALSTFGHAEQQWPGARGAVTNRDRQWTSVPSVTADHSRLGPPPADHGQTRAAALTPGGFHVFTDVKVPD